MYDAGEAADEYDHGADLLHDDCGVADKRPELILLDSRIALQSVKEGFLVGIVVRILKIDVSVLQIRVAQAL